MVQAAAAYVANAVGSFIGWLGASAGAVSLAYQAAFYAAQAAIYAGISYGVNAATRPKVERSLGVELDLAVDADFPRQMIIGHRAVAGSLVDHVSYGTSNWGVSLVYAIADHPCTSLLKVFADGRLIHNTSLVHGVRTEILAYNDGEQHMFMTWHDGRAGQTADAQLIANSSGKWTSNHKGAGVAYVHIEMIYHPDNLNTVPKFLFEIEGAPLYDRRLDTTAGGSGSHRLNDPSTWAYTDNAMVALDHYMLGYKVESETLAFGIGLLPDEIPYDTFAATADLCDEDVVTGVGAYEETIKRYRANGVIGAHEEFIDVVEALQVQMAARIVDLGGRIGVIGAEAKTTEIDLTDQDLVRGDTIEYADKLAFVDLIGAVEGRFTDPGLLWQPDEFDRQQSADYQLPDGGEATVQTLELSFETNRRRAARLASAYLERERLQPRLVASFMPRAWRLEVGDWFTYSDDYLQLDEAEFEVLDVIKHPDFTVTLTARAANSDFVAFDVNVDADLSVPPDYPPEDLSLDVPVFALAEFELTSGVTVKPVIKATKTTLDPLARSVVFEWQSWSGSALSGDSFADEIHAEQDFNYLQKGIMPGAAYKVRYKAKAGRRESAWSAWSSVITATGLEVVSASVTATTALAAAAVPWTGVTGAGKPEDNATDGADWDSNVSNRPTTLDSIQANWDLAIQRIMSDDGSADQHYGALINADGHIRGFVLAGVSFGGNPTTVNAIFNVDQFAIGDPSASRVPFRVSGGNVYLENATIEGGSFYGGELSASASIVVGSGANAFTISGQNATWATWGGQASPEGAPYRVARDGSVYARNIFIEDADGVLMFSSVGGFTAAAKTSLLVGTAAKTNTASLSLANDSSYLTLQAAAATTFNMQASINMAGLVFAEAAAPASWTLQLRYRVKSGPGAWQNGPVVTISKITSGSPTSIQYKVDTIEGAGYWDDPYGTPIWVSVEGQDIVTAPENVTASYTFSDVALTAGVEYEFSIVVAGITRGRAVTVSTQSGNADFILGGSGGSGSGGSSGTFTYLSDTPSAYAGQALKLLRVKAAEDGVEFAAPTYLSNTVDAWSKSSDTYDRFYFGNAGATYIKGHSSSPIVFRNAADATIGYFSSVGLTVVGNIEAVDIYANRGDGTGVIYFAAPGADRYLYYNGSVYIMPNADLSVNGSYVGTMGRTNAWTGSNSFTSNVSVVNLTASGYLAVSRATGKPYIDIVRSGTLGSDYPELRLRTSSQYSRILASASELQFQFNYTGTPVTLSLTASGLSIDGSFIGHMSRNNTWTGYNYYTGVNDFISNSNLSIGDAGSSQHNFMVARGSAGGGAAVLTMHRPGAFAAYLGLDTDNKLKYGGWSVGSVAYNVYHEGRTDLISESNVASTLAKRNASGHLHVNYIRVENGMYTGSGMYIYNSSGAWYMRGLDAANSRTYFQRFDGTTLGSLYFESSGAIGFLNNVGSWQVYFHNSNGMVVYGTGGYATFGPQNAGYCHMITDTPAFYMNRPLYIAGALINYSYSYFLDDSATGQYSYLRGTSPTLHFRDTDNNRTVSLHQNNNYFYILRHATAETTSWDSGPNGRHPMTMDTNTGNVTFSGNMLAYSDARLKSNVLPFVGAADMLRASRPVAFDMDGKRQVGFIAQQMEPIAPWLLGEAGGWKTFDYSRWVAVLTAGWQSHDQELTLLRRQVANQNERIEAQDARIARLEKLVG